MPVRYRCRNCGAVLYEFKRVGQDYIGVPTPREVAFMYHFTCPVCKSQLNWDTSNPDWREHIVVKPARDATERKQHKRKRKELLNAEESESTNTRCISGVTFLSGSEFLVDEY